MTKEQLELIAKANAFENIENTNGWLVVLGIIEEIKKEVYGKWLKMTPEKMTSKQAYDLRAQAQSCRELLIRLDALKIAKKLEVKREHDK